MPLRVPEPRGAPPLSRTRLPASPDGAKRRSGVHPSACIADGRRSVNSGVAIPCAWYAARDTLRATMRVRAHLRDLRPAAPMLHTAHDRPRTHPELRDHRAYRSEEHTSEL